MKAKNADVVEGPFSIGHLADRAEYGGRLTGYTKNIRCVSRVVKSLGTGETTPGTAPARWLALSFIDHTRRTIYDAR